MTGMKYCGNCKRWVTPKREMSVLALVILLILGIIPGIIYLIYYLLKPKVCPMCNSQNWTIAPKEEPQKV